MQSGTLREKLILQVAGTSRDALGGEIISWGDVATLWGRVDAITGREVHAAQQIHAEVTLRVQIRHRTDVTAGNRLLWGTTVLAIHAVLPDTQRHMITLLCSSGLGDG